MKFNVGDKVRVRTFESMAQEFGVNEYGSAKCPWAFTREMGSKSGKIVTIKAVVDGLVKIIPPAEDSADSTWNDYIWHESMFEPIIEWKFKIGDKVRVRTMASIKKEFGVDYLSHVGHGYSFIPDMQCCSGKIVTITELLPDGTVKFIPPVEDSKNEVWKIYIWNEYMFEPIIKGRFEIGDLVKVVNPGATYDTYDTWIKKYCTEQLVMWKSGRLPSLGGTYEVTCVAPHYDGDYMIYGIQELHGNKFFVIAEEGLVKIKDTKEEENTMFEVGDRVKVIHSGNTYCTYQDWIERNCPAKLSDWAKGRTAKENEEYVVECVAKHRNVNEGILYGIRALNYNQNGHTFFIVGENGLEKIKPENDFIRRSDVKTVPCCLYSGCEVETLLNDAPTAKVETIKTGHWTEVRVDANGYGMTKYQHKECPAPNGAELRLHDYPFPICPFCGAHMDKK